MSEAFAVYAELLGVFHRLGRMAPWLLVLVLPLLWYSVHYAASGV
jgi:hypothetical protein